nr:hypothetical protein [Angustibacter aerolatus]
MAREQVVYLVQDWEPGFMAWGTEHALARHTYRAGFEPAGQLGPAGRVPAPPGRCRRPRRPGVRAGGRPGAAARRGRGLAARRPGPSAAALLPASVQAAQPGDHGPRRTPALGCAGARRGPPGGHPRRRAGAAGRPRATDRRHPGRQDGSRHLLRGAVRDRCRAGAHAQPAPEPPAARACRWPGSRR